MKTLQFLQKKYSQSGLKTRFISVMVIVVILLFSGFGSLVYFNRIKTHSEQAHRTLEEAIESIKSSLFLLQTCKEQNLQYSQELTRKWSQLLETLEEDELDFSFDANTPSLEFSKEDVIHFVSGIIKEKRIYEQGYVFITDLKGEIKIHPYLSGKIENKDLINKINSLKKGQTLWVNPQTREKEWIHFEFIEALDVVVLASVPEEEITGAPIRKVMRLAVFSMIIALALFITIASALANSVIKPIKKSTKVLNELSRGNLAGRIDISNRDELGQMAISVNNIIDGMINTSRFAREIEKGNFDQPFSPLSDNDELGKALIDMRKSLIEARKIDQERKLEDQKRNWTTEGLATFAEILRQNNENLEVLYFQIIKNLVKYLNCNQGGLFILNDDKQDDAYLELVSCYAYDRRKYLSRKIYPGEGLTGACFVERKTIYMKDIPQDYILITSGLGQANPNCLIIVPLIINDTVFGVVELASFKAFLPHEIEFIEKIAESIASTISTVRINHRTALLLQQSQIQQEEMKAQEEEMRQNMEELHATQEEMERKNQEMLGVMTAINASCMVSTYDLNGKLISANDAFLNFLRINIDAALGIHFTHLVDFNEKPQQAYIQFWNEVKQGKTVKTTSKLIVEDKYYWLEETYGPISDRNGNLLKIFKVAFNITQYK